MEIHDQVDKQQPGHTVGLLWGAKRLCDIYYRNSILQKSRNRSGWIFYWPGCICEWMELVLCKVTFLLSSYMLQWLTLTPISSPAGRGLRLVDRAVGQTLRRRIPLTHDHQIHPRQLLPGQSGGQWLSTGQLSVAGHRRHVPAAGRSSRGARSSSAVRGGGGWGLQLQLSMHRVKRRCSFKMQSTSRGHTKSYLDFFYYYYYYIHFFYGLFELVFSSLITCITPSFLLTILVLIGSF